METRKPEPKTNQVLFRLGDKELRQMDRFADRKGWTRAKVLRWMIKRLPLAKQEVAA